jgi:hypothetical protein
MANVPTVGAPAMITASLRSIEQGRVPPSLARHRRRPGESLLYASACLGFYLCGDADFFLLIGVGLRLLHT